MIYQSKHLDAIAATGYSHGYKQAIQDVQENLLREPAYTACGKCWIKEDFMYLNRVRKIVEQMKNGK